MKPDLEEYYYENGQIGRQIWYLNEQLHNESGPALIKYNNSGKIIKQRWFINGKEYTEEEFKHYQLIKKMAGIV